jgi:hypothetical protein
MALAGDGLLKARLAVYQTTGRNLGRVYAATLSEPVPSRLIAAVHAAQSETVIRRATAPSGLGARLGAWLAGLGGPRTTFAISATALVAGIAAGWIAATAVGGRPPAGIAGGADLLASGALAESLETATSGTIAAPAGARTLLTFKDRRGRFCREYEIAGALESTGGIACRGTEGDWRIVAHVVAPTSPRNPGYASAGSSREAIDRMTDVLKAGEVLEAVQEKDLIARKWR